LPRQRAASVAYRASAAAAGHRRDGAGAGSRPEDVGNDEVATRKRHQRLWADGSNRHSANGLRHRDRENRAHGAIGPQDHQRGRSALGIRTEELAKDGKIIRPCCKRRTEALEGAFCKDISVALQSWRGGCEHERQQDALPPHQARGRKAQIHNRFRHLAVSLIHCASAT
jgi:hypothetical protein